MVLYPHNVPIYQIPAMYICSSRMSPLPHPHTSGNMWLAKCDYISQLIDPKALSEGTLPKAMSDGNPVRDVDGSSASIGYILIQAWNHAIYTPERNTCGITLVSRRSRTLRRNWRWHHGSSFNSILLINGAWVLIRIPWRWMGLLESGGRIMNCCTT